MSKNSKAKWDKVRKQMESGSFPKVFIAKSGKLALDGSGKDLPADIAALCPAEILADAEAKAEARKAVVSKEAAEWFETIRKRTAEREAVIEQYRNVRSWRLAGLFVDDVSIARYTYAEIESWLDWDAYNLRHNHADVKIICERSEQDGGEFCIDVSFRFANPCNDKRRTPSFETITLRLRDYVTSRRESASANN